MRLGGQVHRGYLEVNARLQEALAAVDAIRTTLANRGPLWTTWPPEESWEPSLHLPIPTNEVRRPLDKHGLGRTGDFAKGDWIGCGLGEGHGVGGKRRTSTRILLRRHSSSRWRQDRQLGSCCCHPSYRESRRAEEPAGTAWAAGPEEDRSIDPGEHTVPGEDHSS